MPITHTLINPYTTARDVQAFRELKARSRVLFWGRIIQVGESSRKQGPLNKITSVCLLELALPMARY